MLLTDEDGGGEGGGGPRAMDVQGDLRDVLKRSNSLKEEGELESDDDSHESDSESSTQLSEIRLILELKFMFFVKNVDFVDILLNPNFWGDLFYFWLTVVIVTRMRMMKKK